MFDTWAARKGHIWQLLAFTVMLGAAYFTIISLQTVGEITSLTDWPEYAAHIAKLEAQSTLWAGLALGLPFLAAALLGRSSQSVHRYLGRLFISVLGTVGLTICLRLISRP